MAVKIYFETIEFMSKARLETSFISSEKDRLEIRIENNPVGRNRVYLDREMAIRLVKHLKAEIAKMPTQ